MFVRPPKKRFLSVAAGLTAGGALAGVASVASEYVVRKLTAPSRSRPSPLDFTPFETGVEWEDVTFEAEDGSALGGWLMPRDATAPVVLACGGYRGRRSNLLGIASALWRAGVTVLLFDYRGYGAEPGTVTLGYQELSDARAGLRYLQHRFAQAPIGAIGFSMGAAVAIMLAAREPDVRAVVADSPFTSQREIVHRHVTTGFRLGASRLTYGVTEVLLHLVNRQLLKRFGFRFEDVHPLQEIRHLAPRPLFLIHGEEDETIPAEHTRRLAEAAQAAGVPTDVWFVPGAGHCGAYFVDRGEYCRRVAAFFAAHLASAARPQLRVAS